MHFFFFMRKRKSNSIFVFIHLDSCILGFLDSMVSRRFVGLGFLVLTLFPFLVSIASLDME